LRRGLRSVNASFHHGPAAIQRKRQQMDFASRFTVSIERSGICRRFAGVVAGTLAAVATLATAPAQGGELAKDLLEAIHAPTTPPVKWARDVNGRRFVQALLLSDSADPDMTDLRAFVCKPAAQC